MNINVYIQYNLFKRHLIPAYNTQYEILISKIPATCHAFREQISIPIPETNANSVSRLLKQNAGVAGAGRSLWHIIRKSTGWLG